MRLWEAETLRVRSSSCMLYDQFETPELYTGAAEYARNIGMLLWCNPVARVFAAKEEGGWGAWGAGAYVVHDVLCMMCC